jgi:hypothetical protein
VHPILAYRGRMGPYLAAWVPLGGLLAGLLRIAGSPWGEAAAIAFPMAIIYGFICLAAWYPCRSASPHTVPFLRVITTQVMAAAVSAMLWLFLVDTWVVLLEQFPVFSKAAERFPRLVPVILAVGVVLYVLAAALHYLLMAFEEARQAERSTLELEVLARKPSCGCAPRSTSLPLQRAQLDQLAHWQRPRCRTAMCSSWRVFRERPPGGRQHPACRRTGAGREVSGGGAARFGSRLRRSEICAEAGARGPAAVLQPLVENAVTHGVANLVGGGVADRGAPKATPALTEPDGPRTAVRSARSRAANVRPTGRAYGQSDVEVRQMVSTSGGTRVACCARALGYPVAAP